MLRNKKTSNKINFYPTKPVYLGLFIHQLVLKNHLIAKDFT